MSYAEAEAILARCAHPNRACEVSSGERVCVDCWNAYVYARRQARKEELAARPLSCARCAARPHRWIVAGYKLCGRCKSAVVREHHAAVAAQGALSIIAALSGPQFSTAGWKGLSGESIAS